MDDVAFEVAQWAVNVIENIVDDLIPNGVPFDGEKMTLKEQVVEYQRTLRGNKEAWVAWIEDKAGGLQAQVNVIFEEMQVDPSFVAAIHPYDIAVRMAVAYSAKMEKELAKQEDATFDRIEAEGRPSIVPSAMPTPEPVAVG
jgi:hypothetical protein